MFFTLIKEKIQDLKIENQEMESGMIDVVECLEGKEG